MKRLILLVGLALGSSALTVSTPAAARNYDCSKAGNANKAACKTTGATVKPTAKASPIVAKAKVSSAAKNSAGKVTAIKSKSTGERTYDCTKAGNRNKAACKAVATGSAPVVKQTSATASARNYDCTKAGNANKAVCKNSGAVSRTSSVRPSVDRSRVGPPAALPRVNAAAGSNGATAQCKDGTYSRSTQHRGACSHHGGVAKWF